MKVDSSNSIGFKGETYFLVGGNAGKKVQAAGNVIKDHVAVDTAEFLQGTKLQSETVDKLVETVKNLDFDVVFSKLGDFISVFQYKQGRKTALFLNDPSSKVQTGLKGIMVDNGGLALPKEMAKERVFVG